MTISMRPIPRRRIAAAVAGTAVLAASVAHAAPQALAAPTAHYTAAVVENQDPTYQYRAMPSLAYVAYRTPTGAIGHRYLRSYQITADGVAPARSRLQYWTGGALNSTSAWRPALDQATGGALLNRGDGQGASAHNLYQFTDGVTVGALDVQLVRSAAGGFSLVRRVSHDGGVHWTREQVPLDLNGVKPATWAGQVFAAPVLLPDGRTWATTWYVGMSATRKLAVHIVTSTDNGAHWKVVATPFMSSSRDYTETAIGVTADHHVVVITRYGYKDAKGHSHGVLFGRRTAGAISSRNSQDSLDRAAWANAYNVVVPGSQRQNGGTEGVAPVLRRFGDGTLGLFYGRPRNKVALSRDGITWGTTHSFFDNMPTGRGCPNGWGGNECGDLGSSGYMGVAMVSGTTARVLMDNCQAGWGCRLDASYPHGRDDKLWWATVTA